MAKYTIELRDIVENGRNIFPFPYEFYDEKQRLKFERDFIRHFYFREIGCETVDRFILNLEDKMNTVFPVYNAMLKAGQIEYKVLDNYYLSETTKRTVESKGKSSGVSSTVGQTFDDQQTDTTESMNGTGTGTQNETGTSETIHNGTSETVGTGKETRTETGSSDTTTSETVDTDTTTNGTVNGTNTKTGSGSSTSEQDVKKKFLDTPQGLTDLTDSKYLTSLNQDESSSSTETESTETVTDNQTTTGTGTTDTKTDGSSSTDTTANGETNTESNNETTVSDTTTGETGRNATEQTSVNQDSTGNVIYKGEQRTTADNNTRLQNDNKSIEETEIIHSGNIGVESDAVMLQKHLKWQQLIAKTFQMFFDECEDLFMMVY